MVRVSSRAIHMNHISSLLFLLRFLALTLPDTALPASSVVLGRHTQVCATLAAVEAVCIRPAFALAASVDSAWASSGAAWASLGKASCMAYPLYENRYLRSMDKALPYAVADTSALAAHNIAVALWARVAWAQGLALEPEPA